MKIEIKYYLFIEISPCSELTETSEASEATKITQRMKKNSI